MPTRKDRREIQGTRGDPRGDQQKLTSLLGPPPDTLTAPLRPVEGQPLRAQVQQTRDQLVDYTRKEIARVWRALRGHKEPENRDMRHSDSLDQFGRVVQVYDTAEDAWIVNGNFARKTDLNERRYTIELPPANGWHTNGAESSVWYSPAIEFADAATKWAQLSFALPPTWQTTGTLSFEFLMMANNGADTISVVTVVDAKKTLYPGNANNAIGSPTTATTLLSAAGYRTFLLTHEVASADLSTAKAVSLRISRIGGDGSDNHTDNLWMLNSHVVLTI